MKLSFCILAACLAASGWATADKAVHAQWLDWVPVLSADRTIRVFGHETTTEDRMALLQLVQQWRHQVARFCGVSESDWLTDLVVHSKQGLKVEPASADGRDGLPERMTVMLPAMPDRWQLYETLCEGWLLTSWNAYASRACLPSFLPVGLSRHLLREHRLADFESVRLRWTRATLPGAAHLFREAALAPRADPALASQLTLFLLQDMPRAGRLRRLAHLTPVGPASDPALVAQAVFGFQNGASLDEHWDRWLLERGVAVIWAGAVSSGAIERFRSQLLLYPGQSGTPLHDPLMPGLSMMDLIDRRHAAWVPDAVDAKRMELMRYAGGRHVDLQTVASAYDDFLCGLRQDLPDKGLKRLLAAAEEKLDRLTLAVQRGTVDGIVPPVWLSHENTRETN